MRLVASQMSHAALGARSPTPINGLRHSHFTEKATEARRDLVFRLSEGKKLARPRGSPLRLKLSFPLWAIGHLTLQETKSRS